MLAVKQLVLKSPQNFWVVGATEGFSGFSLGQKEPDKF